jgi:hypothetical protein
VKGGVLTPTEDESADGETTLDVNGMSPDYAAKNIALWANVTTARTFRSPSLLILAFPKTAVLLPPFLPFNGQKCVENPVHITTVRQTGVLRRLSEPAGA